MIKVICQLRDINIAMNDLEIQLNDKYGVGLNEAMALCCLSEGRLSASEIAEMTGMTSSHCSKVIRSVEQKMLIERSLGENDKRQMYFNLNKEGKKVLSQIKCKGLVLPEILQPVLGHCDEE
ncbi:DNA-binding transcriptional regulator, MarR family [Bacteroides luti]|jgi:Transcriptional regulators|uniref:DNA-binding transcriptional regulator, MarR family n=1 Tax=Bacteroides luti TaxID=1297750 RepID=A0A1M4V8K6_9BACE|nr:winged helix DNA-binding protein [Bacteroides luti]SHE65262.1 DNA-binding transcriptional regulator, MarR family [Bacteroides luti]